MKESTNSQVLKIEDLRIGNWVRRLGISPVERSLLQIEKAHMGNLCSHEWYIDTLTPLILTEDILELAGFEKEIKEGYDYEMFSLGCFHLFREYWDKKPGDKFLFPQLMRYGNPWEFKSCVVVEHVHHLQNLYRFYEGKELEFEFYFYERL